MAALPLWNVLKVSLGSNTHSRTGKMNNEIITCKNWDCRKKWCHHASYLRSPPERSIPFDALMIYSSSIGIVDQPHTAHLASCKLSGSRARRAWTMFVCIFINLNVTLTFIRLMAHQPLDICNSNWRQVPQTLFKKEENFCIRPYSGRRISWNAVCLDRLMSHRNCWICFVFGGTPSGIGHWLSLFRVGEGRAVA